MTEALPLLQALAMPDHADTWARETSQSLRDGGPGAHAALDALYRHRHGLVWEVVARATAGRRDLALDAAQEAWVRVARHPVSCPHAGALDAWLRRVAVSAALDLLRREYRAHTRALRAGRQVRSPVHAEHAAQTAQAALDELAWLGRQLDALTVRERSVLDLRYRAGLRVDQVAAALGMGRAATESALRRTLARLRTEERP